MRDHAVKRDPPAPSESKTFEDAAFEMISTVSPIKLPRETIPFDSVRQIVLNEILKSKQKSRPSTNGRRNMDDLLLDEAATSSSSSSHLGESSSSILERGTMTDDGETGTPRPIATRLYGDNTRSSTTSTSSAGPSGTSEATETTKKKPLNYREKRLAEIRATRMKKYRENAEIVEFKCEESGLEEAFSKFLDEILTEEACPANIYYRVVESLDFYFRAKTWESNCPKLLCEFLCENILKTCQEMNELHDKSTSTDELKSREIQIQVLLTLHVFVVTDERKWLDESINKMRMIFIAVGPAKLRTFVEEPVTDIFLEIIGDSLATIYEELCINLPPDLLQYNGGMFKMTECDDTFVVKRRNGIANRLEQILMESSDNFGVGASERPSRSAAAPEVSKRRSLKRRNEEIPKELLSPTRPPRAAAAGRSDYKQFFVEDTPDEKYKRKIKKEEIDEDEEEPEDDDDEEEEDDDEEEDEEEVTVVYHRKKKITIKEEIDEEVKQTPVAKLRASAASHNGKRCSKRLSDLVKLSEERSQVPKKARENLNKILEKAKTPARSVTRPTRKSVLFGETPTSSPATMSAGKKSRSSLLSRFAQLDEKKPEGEELSVDTSGGHDLPTTSSESTTPVSRERSTRKKQSTRFRDDSAEQRVPVKQEPEDSEFDEIEMRSPRSTKASTSSVSSSASKWTDRKLRRQLGLTREDLNRYREAMLSTGERNTNKNESINWENAQVNRAGRVKGAGAGEDGAPIFGIARRNVRTMICHVLLNETNPDTSFNWNKVKFDELGDKPRTRQLESLIKNPEAYMESLKQQYIKSKASPLKRSRSAASAISSEPSTSSSGILKLKKRKIMKKVSPRKSEASTSIAMSSSTPSLRFDDFDDFGFETEADE